MPRSCRANTVPCAMTNRLRSLASRVITSWASASASPAAGAGRRGPVDERHHRDGGAARRAERAVVAAAAAAAVTAKRRLERAAQLSPCALAERHASRIGAQSRPSASNSRVVAARCSSPSRIRPRRASASSRSSWTRRSNGASSSHFSRWPSTSSSGALPTRCSSSAA